MFFEDSMDFSFKMPPQSYLIPSCLQCLEKLDSDTTSLEWSQGSVKKISKVDHLSCQICYKIHHRKIQCEKCMLMEEIWVCLLCGFAGCGRYENKHAFYHYEESNHCFSLDMKTGLVWDYRRDVYVHRLPEDILKKGTQENESDYVH